MGDIEIMVLDEERLENNVGYGNIKERAPEGALWFFVLLHYFFLQLLDLRIRASLIIAFHLFVCFTVK